MAGSKLNYRLRASTLPEVLVAMVIILVVFGIAMTIFTNVMRLSLSAKKLRAAALLEKALRQSGDDTEDSTFSMEEFRVTRETKPYPRDPTLIDIYMTAYDPNGQKTAEIHQILSNEK
ncbi:type II secretion system protein [Mucilaginibacter sp.]|uniref:type II secretion system protein n=1 Tax=Mucilaginibacter sp. TaxID=1882438 RepID=UPI003D0D9A1B